MRSLFGFLLLIIILSVSASCFATESFDFEFNSEHIKILYSDNFGTPHQEHDRGMRRLEYFQQLIINLENLLSRILEKTGYSLENKIIMGFSYYGVEKPVYKPEDFKVILPITKNIDIDTQVFLELLSMLNNDLKDIVRPETDSWTAVNTMHQYSDYITFHSVTDRFEGLEYEGCKNTISKSGLNVWLSTCTIGVAQDESYLLKTFNSIDNKYFADILYLVQDGTYKVRISDHTSYTYVYDMDWHLPVTPLVWDNSNERVAFSIEKEIRIIDVKDKTVRNYKGLKEYIDQLAWAPEWNVLYARERKAGRGDIVRITLRKNDLEYMKLGIKGDEIIGTLRNGDLLYIDKGQMMKNAEIHIDNTAGYFQSALGPAYYYNSGNDYISGFFPNLKKDDYSKQFLGDHDSYVFIPYKDWPTDDKKVLLDTFGDCFCHLLSYDPKFIFLDKTSSEIQDLLELLKKLKAWPVDYDPDTGQIAVISSFWGSPDIWLIKYGDSPQ